MSWAVGYDSNWKRDIGYGVPAICDYPNCNERIDRGLSYVCGGEPYGGDRGCGLYFCDKHHAYIGQLCTRCARKKLPFKPKPDLQSWIRHKMTASWAEWQKEQREPRPAGGERP